jgi:hypothetical protein
MILSVRIKRAMPLNNLSIQTCLVTEISFDQSTPNKFRASVHLLGLCSGNSRYLSPLPVENRSEFSDLMNFRTRAGIAAIIPEPLPSGQKTGGVHPPPSNLLE